MKFTYWNKAKKSFMVIDGIISLCSLGICFTAQTDYFFLLGGVMFLIACTLLIGFLIINTTCWVWFRTREKNHVPIWKCLRLTVASCVISSLSLWIFYSAIAPSTSKFALIFSGCFTAAGYFLYKKRFLRRNNNERLIYFVFSVILPSVLCMMLIFAELLLSRTGDIPLTLIATGIIILNYAPISAVELARISIKRVL